MYNNIKILSANSKLKLADPTYNKEKIKEIFKKADEEKIDLISLGELSLTGASLYDLYREDVLIGEVYKAIEDLLDFSKNLSPILALTSILKKGANLYNACLIIYRGEILDIFVKENLKKYEKMVFSNTIPEYFRINSRDIKVNNNIPLEIKDIKLGISIGEDEKSPIPRSLIFKQGGANVILNPHAYERYILSEENHKEAIRYLSKDIIYISTPPGVDESSTDFVYQTNNIIADNGKIIDKSKDPLTGIFRIRSSKEDWSKTYKDIEKFPYLPKDNSHIEEYIKDAFEIAAEGLMTRLRKIHIKDVYLGLSGGLDSTMALLFIYYGFEKYGISKDHIHLITMPAFGTSKRTKSNAHLLAAALGLSLKEIDISEAVRIHLRDLGHDGKSQDITYENAQARERTQVLFDLANKGSGLVIGTGDLSEAMQGFATYNGDHMSNYAINSSLTKTHLRYIIGKVLEKTSNKDLKIVLEDILATPISPELKNESSDGISQRTEDIIGPYELIDFFIYQQLKNKYSPKEIFYRAKIAFEDSYDEKTIEKWLRSYYKRFVASQFKRSASVDGVSITGLSYSPRTGYKIPSDLSSEIYLGDISE
ncbi:MAG: NAD(+) synthase [Anaerococcus sp.]|nr:NAD(+) synthase [Anaerococcus sp.]